jgi:hypothetical protein
MLCPNKPTWSHDFLREGIPCPYCEEPTSDNVSATTTTASTKLSTASATSVGSTSAIHSAVKSVNAFRAQNITKHRATATPPLYRFDVRVAHAAFIRGSAMTKFTCFPGSFKHCIPQSKVFNYRSFHREFENAGWEITYNLPHWRSIMNPGGIGTWQLATNHLPKTNPVPAYLTGLNDNEDIRIQEIMTLAGYQKPKKTPDSNATYPITLI